jgi:hypothetical protein
VTFAVVTARRLNPVSHRRQTRSGALPQLAFIRWNVTGTAARCFCGWIRVWGWVCGFVGRGAQPGGMTRTESRAELGAWGEQVAVDYLQGQGLRVLARNWRCRYGELDQASLPRVASQPPPKSVSVSVSVSASALLAAGLRLIGWSAWWFRKSRRPDAHS